MKYLPKTTKTMQKALRPLPSQTLIPPPNIRLKVVERMESLVKEARNGNGLNTQYAFVLKHLSTVVSFHQAMDQREKDRFLIQIGKNEEEGHRLGFDQEELNSLNFLVLRVKVKGQLTVFEGDIKKKSLNPNRIITK